MNKLFVPTNPTVHDDLEDARNLKNLHESEKIRLRGEVSKEKVSEPVKLSIDCKESSVGMVGLLTNHSDKIVEFTTKIITYTIEPTQTLLVGLYDETK